MKNYILIAPLILALYSCTMIQRNIMTIDNDEINIISDYVQN